MIVFAFSPQSLVRLLSVISSFPVLFELLNVTTPQEATPTATPTTLFQLLDRLVLVDSAPKQHALLGYEESHLVGVRIVSVVTTCLDSLLLLQERTGFLDALISLQREERRDDGYIEGGRGGRERRGQMMEGKGSHCVYLSQCTCVFVHML